jgi:adenylate cyclase
LAKSQLNKQAILRRVKLAVPVVIICILVNLVAVRALLQVHARGGSGVVTNFLASVENKSVDLRFLLRGDVKPSGKIGILAIDEKSIQKFGRWPFPRKVFEKAFVNLKKNGAEWIGFDVVWDQPERALLEDAIPVIEQMRESPLKARQGWDAVARMRTASLADLTIASAIKDYGKIVMGYYFYSPGEKDTIAALGNRRFDGLKYIQDSVISAVQIPEGRELKDYEDLSLGAVVGNTPVIAESSPHAGFFNNNSDSDDAIWRDVNLLKQAEGQLLPSLALKLAANILNRQIVVSFDRIGVESILLPDEDDEKKLIEIPLDPIGNGKILINHLGRSRTLRHVSLADAYDDSFSNKERQAVKGMSFILGPTAIAVNDLRANPFDATFNGVEQHATIVDNIISKRFFKRPKDVMKTELYVLIGLALVFAVVLSLSSAFVSAVFLVATYIVYYHLDKYFWFGKGTWVYIGLPYIQVTTMFIFVTIYKYFVEERERRKVKGAFQHYLSGDVMEQVLNDPDRLKLGGERRECTMFFSDVRDFTTISESLPPDKLVELMNDYLSPMTDIILKSGGVLDKYIGDAIMAFWGAPLDSPDQADVAAMVVLQMLEKLQELRLSFPKKNFPPVDIGCGLNTGVVSVGNMGSSERFAYTVMGDAVNLCARLESITKEYGVRSLISQNTLVKMKKRESFLIRDVDDIIVKGKREAVKIFELMHPNYFMVQSVIPEFLGEFELMRKAYRSQDWLKAKKHLESCLMIRPDDGPSNVYFKRIKELELQPKIDDWDGVHRFKYK